MANRRFRVPHTLVLLFGMIVLGLVLTYILPPGSFDRAENEAGRMQVVPGSFHETPDVEPLSPLAVLTAVPEGLSAAHEIIFFVFIIGGAFGVLRATGAIDAALGVLLRRLGNRPLWLIAGGVAVFAAGSSTIGMAEEYLPFVPVLVALATALGYDAVTAVGIMTVGYGVGYGVAAINPFTVLIAQDVAGLQPASGLWLRLLLTAVFLPIGIHHVWRYAKKVGEDPGTSLVADVDEEPESLLEDGSNETSAGGSDEGYAGHGGRSREQGEAYGERARNEDEDDPEDEPAYPPLTQRHRWVLGALGLALAVLIYGLARWHWYLVEMSALFVAVTIVLAAIARMSADRTAVTFGKGAAELTTTALMIGVARGIQVVLDDGGVVDTIVHGISVPLQSLPSSLAAVGMYVTQSVANFFIPSGSGQAYVTMPIMAPLADLVGVTRQVAVLAYQFGDGFTNILVPTNAVLVGILAMAAIPYERWLRFVVPFMLKVWVVGSLALAVAVWIGYG